MDGKGYGCEGKGLVVWYSGDDLGCIASRMPHLDYNIGRRFTRIWRYSVADQRYLGYALIKPSRPPVKLEDTLSVACSLACLLCERESWVATRLLGLWPLLVFAIDPDYKLYRNCVTEDKSPQLAFFQIINMFMCE